MIIKGTLIAKDIDIKVAISVEITVTDTMIIKGTLIAKDIDIKVAISV